MKQKIFSILSFLSGCLLGYAVYLFLGYNSPIIKNLPLLALVVGCLILGILTISVLEFFSVLHKRTSGRIYGLFLLIAAGLLVFVFLQSAVLDYFQPFSLYDDLIYVTLAAFLILILRFIVQAILLFFGKPESTSSFWLAGISLLLIGSLWVWKSVQADFIFQNIRGEPIPLFEGGKGEYEIYRIPSLVTIPQGAKLADGTPVAEDIVIAYAEARRNGSLDDGEVDLVMRRSVDAGRSWYDLSLVREWEQGTGKIGNATPVFDTTTGKLHLFHIAGSKPPYDIWIMESLDGGQTYSSPRKLEQGIVGPGHGVQTASGRLIVPAHVNGSSFALYSDDHGKTWQFSEPVGTGNESEIAETEPGTLISTVRTNHPVSQPHGPLYQLFSHSTDDGVTWSAARENSDLRTPIVMTSILRNVDAIYFSYPDDFYSRARMTVAKSTDQGNTFPEKYLIYPGPSGYSDITALTNGDILLLFENGAVEYDQRLTLVKLDGD